MSVLRQCSKIHFPEHSFYLVPKQDRPSKMFKFGPFPRIQKSAAQLPGSSENLH